MEDLKQYRKLNLWQKICKVMESVESVTKDTKVSTGKDKSGNEKGYSAVSHDAVAAKLHGPLSQIGIVVKPNTVQRSLEVAMVKNYYDKDVPQFRVHLVVEVWFINADQPSERECVTMDGFSFDSGDKAIGKAESLAVKYALLKLFMLESRDEEESREHENQIKEYVQPKPKPNVAQHKFTLPSPEKEKALGFIQKSLAKQPSWETDKAKILKEITGVETWTDVMLMGPNQLLDIEKKLLTQYYVE